MIFVGEVLAFDSSGRAPLVYQGGQYALAARKPRHELRLGATPPPECSYTEDLLGYLLGRAHYQLLDRLRRLMASQQLDEHLFFVLSVLCIRDNLTLDELNAFVAYTGHRVSAQSLAELERRELIAGEPGRDGSRRYLLTAAGREQSLHEIALAKAVEGDVADQLEPGDVMALKVLLKRLVAATDPGLPDLWAGR